MRGGTGIGAVLMLVSLASCGRSKQGGHEAAAVASTGPSIAERPMALRSEAQVVLDSARFALLRGNHAAAVPLLRRAATFFSRQSYTPPTSGSEHLVDVSLKLHALADSLETGFRLGPQRVDRVSAYANVAEAERHGALASLAWATRSKESACDELLMAADHTERANADGGMLMPQNLRSLIDSMRVLARTLAPVPGVDPQLLDEPLTELQAELRALRRRLDITDTSSTKSRWGGL